MYDPTAMAPVCGGLRVRREYVARDAINSRAWDFFHATPPTQTASANMISQARDGRGLVYMDMNPINSRTNGVKYRLQPEYIPDPTRSATTNADLGVPPPATATRLPPLQFSANEYTQRLDAKGDYSRAIWCAKCDRPLQKTIANAKWMPIVPWLHGNSMTAGCRL